jgi:hypothetical protein
MEIGKLLRDSDGLLLDDVKPEHHGHWAVGWVDGYAVRVLRDGRPTRAAQVLFEIAQRLDNYPVLNEFDYAEREREEEIANG